MDSIDEIKAVLDYELKSSLPDVGIVFGVKLFNEFKVRGWLTIDIGGGLNLCLVCIKCRLAIKRTLYSKLGVLQS
ncbi:hypothetical protein [Methylobacter sp. S3L5C]|uniref:hypothetical protein n=1 Tax=Methylobacter sp. S3L5C TaxID=2839024 RepID=UPI001FAC953B|nr:hypothetical protein [Methylobacter sp. S3L5C]UOA09180.1 hypothetical protein KKZ03_02355 [Methylobacter sp. S3L5C]